MPTGARGVVSMQSSGAGRALAFGLWAARRMTVTDAAEGAGRTPLSTAQRSMVSPTCSPVTCVVGLFGETITTPAPCTTVHVPTAGKATVLPAITVVVVGVQRSWSGPAFAAAIPASGGNTLRQVTLLRDLGATVLCCTPSYALIIAEVLERERVPAAELAFRGGVLGAGSWSGGMPPLMPISRPPATH